MDKKIAGLLAGVAGLATVSTAQAAIQPAPDPAAALRVTSYADLLAPIPDAVTLLAADNAARVQQPSDGVQLAQAYYYPPYSYPYYNYHHHHHHHHNNFYGRYYNNRRHHHHHHNGSFVGIPGIGGVVVGGH